LADDTAAARRVINADGAVVAPGFIDLHTHSDFTLPVYPGASSMIRQGVTTQVVGNCGFSPFPAGSENAAELREYTSFIDAGIQWDQCGDAASFMAYLDSLPLACNVAIQVGLGTVRLATLGFERRSPTPSEMARMKEHIHESFRAGVVGVSSGLVYPPGSYATTDEVIELVAVAATYQGFYSTHIRNETRDLQQAVEEALAIARAADIPLQLSHHKVIGSANWGAVEATLETIDGARAAGEDVLADQYPYRAGSTAFTQILPEWVLEDGIAGVRAAILNPDRRQRIVADMARPDAVREFNPTAILLAEIPEGPNQKFEGRYLAEVAADVGEDSIDLALRLIVEEGTGILMVAFGMSEDDVRRVMAHPAVAIASDGWTLDPAVGGKPHPRSYGTFARVLGTYVRTEHVLSLETAVHKMTGLPASRLLHSGRGLIEPGKIADLVVFDPQAITDLATFDDPHQFSVGVEHVIVAGVSVVEHGKETGAPAGRVLRRQGGTNPVE
jgi:N-acyl-D-amino-acid deacylase